LFCFASKKFEVGRGALAGLRAHIPVACIRNRSCDVIDT